MAITKIQAGALPADVITTAAINDASITHAKLHTAMDLSSKTVTLPTLSTLNTSGNIGIGTSSPAYPLEVQSGGVGTVLRAGASFVSIDSTGSEASPSLIFNGDSNTGIYRAAADTLAIATGGTERVRITSGGEVGIGETAPLGKLHVKNGDSGATADVGADELVVENNTHAGITILSGQSYNGSIYFGDAGVNYDGFITYGQGTRSMGFGSAAGTRMTLDSSGNVGIGTSNPSTMLHLSAGTTGSQGGSHAGITMTNKYDNPDNSWSIRPSRDGLSNTGLEIRDVTDDRSVMAFDGAGNVGIGTNSPDAPLDVTRVGDGTIAIFQNTGLHGFEISAPSSTTLQIASRQGSKNLDLWANTLSFSAGGSQRMAIDSSGRVTKPNQPAFSYLGTKSYDIPTTATTVMSSANVWASSVNHALNKGNHFNASTGRFTAPVAGTYHFQFQCTYSDFGSGYLWFYMNINGSAKSYMQASQQTPHSAIVNHMYCDLAASDYVDCSWTNNYNSGYIHYPGFSGRLVG